MLDEAKRILRMTEWLLIKLDASLLHFFFYLDWVMPKSTYRNSLKLVNRINKIENMIIALHLHF